MTVQFDAHPRDNGAGADATEMEFARGVRTDRTGSTSHD